MFVNMSSYSWYWFIF